MIGITRRNAVKLAASGIAAGGALLLAREAPGKEAAEDRWKGHKTADPKQLEKKTQPFPCSQGIAVGKPAVPDAQLIKEYEAAFTPMGAPLPADYWGSPRPDLNGLRVKMPNRPEIYLIDRGFRRWIPDPATYNNLFRDWNGVVIDIDINEIPLAAQITSGAVLAKGYATAAVYLVDQGTKRWIVSPAMMDKYYFSWQRVYVLPQVAIDFIPSGPAIDS